MCYKKRIKKFNKIFIPIAVALFFGALLIVGAAKMEKLVHAQEATIKFGFFEGEHTGRYRATSKFNPEKCKK